MNTTEQIRILKKAGFWLAKTGSKHDLYTNGMDIILVSRGQRIGHNTERSFKSKLRKILERQKNQRSA